MVSYLCLYHSYDGPFKDSVNTKPEINCQCCRAEGYFTKAQIEEYERTCFRLVAIFKRSLGYPERLHVIMADGDTEEEARRIGPKGSFKFVSLSRCDPYVTFDDNTIVLQKSQGTQTLEDTRREWDKAPSNCY